MKTLLKYTVENQPFYKLVNGNVASAYDYLETIRKAKLISATTPEYCTYLEQEAVILERSLNSVLLLVGEVEVRTSYHSITTHH